VSYLDPITGDWAFVAAAYGVILGGVGLYAITLVRRLRRARGANADLTPNAPKPAPSPSSEPPADPGA
jgi:hypothetical protein